MPTTHGQYRSLTHVSWMNMKQRCLNPKSSSYKYYGGRGITICERWLKFENFLADMGTRPSSKHSIERENNNKGYLKSNCHWALVGEQARNRHQNRFVTIDGRTQCIQDWALEKGVPRTRVSNRIRSGMDPVDAILKPRVDSATKTECVNGHPFSGDNLYITKRGNRCCRACQKIMNAAYRLRIGIQPRVLSRKLTDGQLLEMYNLRDKFSGQDLARMFGVGESLVSAVKHVKYYRLRMLLNNKEAAMRKIEADKIEAGR